MHGHKIILQEERFRLTIERMCLQLWEEWELHPNRCIIGIQTGGIVLALFGDYRIMCGGQYKTGLNEVQVGLVVSAVIKNALVRLIGPQPAAKILIPGKLLSPEQAHELGLVDEVESDPEAVVKRSIELCEQLLTLPRNAMLATRTLAREDLHALFEHEHSLGVDAFLELWFSDETQKTLKELVARLQKK